ADLLVIDGNGGDPYDALIRSRETDIKLVMINGIARYGTGPLMDALAPRDQTVRVGGQSRRLFLHQGTTDGAVAPVSLSTATATLRKALRDIAKVAKEAERPKRTAVRRALDAPTAPVWSLALDEIRDNGVELRPRLPLNGPRDFTGPAQVPRAALPAASAPLSQILGPIALDPLTVADDAHFLTLVEKQPNVPEAIRRGLRDLY